MVPLTAKKRSELRSEAHKLDPLVIIGDKGLTDEVVAEIDRTLKAHELVKVRAATDDRGARDAWLKEICGRLQAHPVQQIGKVFVIFREDPEARQAPKPAAKLPPKPNARGPGRRRAEPAAAPPRFRRPKEAAKEVADEVKRTSRRQSRTPAPRPESGPRRRPRSTSR